MGSYFAQYPNYNSATSNGSCGCGRDDVVVAYTNVHGHSCRDSTQNYRQRGQETSDTGGVCECTWVSVSHILEYLLQPGVCHYTADWSTRSVAWRCCSTRVLGSHG